MSPAVRIRQLDREEARSVKQVVARMGPKVFPRATRDQGEGESQDRTTEGCFDFGIEVDERLVGIVQNYIPSNRILSPGTFEIGIAIFDGSARGRGIGTEALGLFIQWLLRERGAKIVQAGTALDNHAMRRSLIKLGFTAGEEVMVGGTKETIFALELT